MIKTCFKNDSCIETTFETAVVFKSYPNFLNCFKFVSKVVNVKVSGKHNVLFQCF